MTADQALYFSHVCLLRLVSAAVVLRGAHGLQERAIARRGRIAIGGHRAFQQRMRRCFGAHRVRGDAEHELYDCFDMDTRWPLVVVTFVALASAVLDKICQHGHRAAPRFEHVHVERTQGRGWLDCDA